MGSSPAIPTQGQAWFNWLKYWFVAPKLRVQVPLLTGTFFIYMRFNFTVVYVDSIAPIFASSAISPRSLICLRGMRDSITTVESFSAFGPIASSFDSDDFASFSKLFEKRNTYLINYLSKKIVQFGNYTNLSIYSVDKPGSIPEKNAVLSRTVKNYRYNSLIFRANGFKLGSLPFREVVGRKAMFFRFFRGISFYSLFLDLGSSIFVDKGQLQSVLLSLFSFLKNFFFKYFVGFGYGRWSKRFKRRHKTRFLRQAFIRFFFFQKNLVRSRRVPFINFPTFYLSETIFFNAKMGFSRRGARRYLPLALY